MYKNIPCCIWLERPPPTLFIFQKIPRVLVLLLLWNALIVPPVFSPATPVALLVGPASAPGISPPWFLVAQLGTLVWYNIPELTIPAPPIQYRYPSSSVSRRWPHIAPGSVWSSPRAGYHWWSAFALQESVSGWYSITWWQRLPISPSDTPTLF